ncbi:MAG: LexA family transcriptional regulator [Prevotella sp.]|nr:LexA family transcriptional regulator [Prevotella sp.]
MRRTRQSVSQALNGNKRYLNKKFVTAFCSAFPGVFNLDWLLTGEGEMLADPQRGPSAPDARTIRTNTADRPHQQQAQSSPAAKGKPYYNVDFALGFDIMENDQTQNPDYLIDFPPYNDCDLFCNAHGDSMQPTISNGDIVALRHVGDISYLINGEIYAIVTTNGLRTIKRVRDNGDTLTLIADNPAVAEQVIPKTAVTHVYHVRGTIKMF